MTGPGAAGSVRVLRGDPDEDEVVALLVVLRLLARRPVAGRPAVPAPAAASAPATGPAAAAGPLAAGVGWPVAAARQPAPWPADPSW
jgi:hypothetical protein